MQGGRYTCSSQVPPTLLTFVSQVPRTVFLHYLYICLPVSCDSLQTNGQCSSESSLEGSPNCSSLLSLHLSPSCNKLLVLQKRFFGRFPNCFGASEKVVWRIPWTVLLYICLPVSCDSLQQMAGASERVDWRFLATVLLYILLPSLIPSSEANGWLVLQKRFFRSVLLCYLYICLPVPCDSLQQTARASEKVLWRVPTTVFLYVCPTVSYTARVLREFSTSPIPWHLHFASLLGYSLGLSFFRLLHNISPSINSFTTLLCQFPTGRLCLSVARKATCFTADVNERWGFHFENVRLEWLNELPAWNKVFLWVPPWSRLQEWILYLEAVAPIIFVHHIRAWVLALIHSSPWIRRSRYISVETLLPTGLVS